MRTRAVSHVVGSSGASGRLSPRWRRAVTAALGLVLCAGTESLVAQSPGVRVSGALSGIWGNPTGVGVFLDLDASERMDLRLSFDAVNGRGTQNYWSGGCGWLDCDPGAPPGRNVKIPAKRRVVGIGVALPIAISTLPSREWRLVPGVHLAVSRAQTTTTPWAVSSASRPDSPPQPLGALSGSCNRPQA